MAWARAGRPRELRATRHERPRTHEHRHPGPPRRDVAAGGILIRHGSNLDGDTAVPRPLTRAAMWAAAAIVPVWATSAVAVGVNRARRRAVIPSDPGFMVSGPGAGGDGQPLRVCILGDSLAAGLGASGRPGSLAVQVGAGVGALAERAVTISGAGIPSATTPVVLEHLDTYIDPDADVVVLIVGANDVLRCTPRRTLQRATTELLERTSDMAPTVLVPVPRFRGITSVGTVLRTLADVLGKRVGSVQRRVARQLAAAGRPITVVDASTVLAARFGTEPELFADDGFHPSDAGYEAIGEVLAGPVALAALAGAARRTRPHRTAHT